MLRRVANVSTGTPQRICPEGNSRFNSSCRLRVSSPVGQNQPSGNSRFSGASDDIATLIIRRMVSILDRLKTECNIF